MHPTIAVGVAALAWLLVHNWSLLARVLLAVAMLLFGWEPASSGAWHGILLVAIASGVAASVAWDDLRGRQPQPRVPPSGSAQNVITASALPERPVRRNRPLPDDVLTELERAEWYGDLLDVNIAGYEEAKRNGDFRAQAAFAGEIEDLATEMREMLRVVLGERHRVAN